MSAVFDKSAYFRRLAIRFGIVGISTVPLLMLNVAGGLVSPWCWLFLLQDPCRLLPNFYIPPAVLVVATLLALSVAALRPASSVVLTLWFAINAVGMWLLLATFQLTPAG